MTRPILTLLCACIVFSTTLYARKNTPRVLAIAVDGIRVDGFQQAHTPHLDALMAEGALSVTTRDAMPSVTLPNWTTILCGSDPEVHGVVDNGWTLGKEKLKAVETDADGYYPSIFTVLKEKVPGVKTAFYYNWINLFYPYNPKRFDEVSYLENDAYLPNYEKAFDFMDKNRNNPTFVFLYDVHTDHAGHRKQWMSPEYITAIEELDAAVGELIKKMKDAGLYDDTYILFLTDHGGIKYGHGGFTLEEMCVPWGIKGPGIKQGFRITEPNNTKNTAPTILSLFGIAQPDVWTGEIPASIFTKPQSILKKLKQ